MFFNTVAGEVVANYTCIVVYKVVSNCVANVDCSVVDIIVIVSVVATVVSNVIMYTVVVVSNGLEESALHDL